MSATSSPETVFTGRPRNPAQWEIVGDFYSYEPYGTAVRKNDADFHSVPLPSGERVG
jgi:hypothetical protein